MSNTARKARKKTIHELESRGLYAEADTHRFQHKRRTGTPLAERSGRSEMDHEMWRRRWGSKGTPLPQPFAHRSLMERIGSRVASLVRPLYTK